ncbi:MAG: hypothetical protein OEY07_14925, partial [Gammaproteobacteria bacterium]|nr:hypothetical protein [Gammaproteobacteria bacterium]
MNKPFFVLITAALNLSVIAIAEENNSKTKNKKPGLLDCEEKTLYYIPSNNNAPKDDKISTKSITYTVCENHSMVVRDCTNELSYVYTPEPKKIHARRKGRAFKKFSANKYSPTDVYRAPTEKTNNCTPGEETLEQYFARNHAGLVAHIENHPDPEAFLNAHPPLVDYLHKKYPTKKTQSINKNNTNLASSDKQPAQVIVPPKTKPAPQVVDKAKPENTHSSQNTRTGDKGREITTILDKHANQKTQPPKQIKNNHDNSHILSLAQNLAREQINMLERAKRHKNQTKYIESVKILATAQQSIIDISIKNPEKTTPSPLRPVPEPAPETDTSSNGGNNSNDEENPWKFEFTLGQESSTYNATNTPSAGVFTSNNIYVELSGGQLAWKNAFGTNCRLHITENLRFGTSNIEVTGNNNTVTVIREAEVIIANASMWFSAFNCNEDETQNLYIKLTGGFIA